jgi:hypothetical protein
MLGLIAIPKFRYSRNDEDMSILSFSFTCLCKYCIIALDNCAEQASHIALFASILPVLPIDIFSSPLPLCIVPSLLVYSRHF